MICKNLSAKKCLIVNELSIVQIYLSLRTSWLEKDLKDLTFGELDLAFFFSTFGKYYFRPRRYPKTPGTQHCYYAN